MHDALTVNQHLLLAAEKLPEPFHESDLAEVAWRSAPRLLGMTNKHDQYPSDNKVRSAMSGERGLVRRGWLVKAGKLTYTLSPTGRAEVERIKRGDPDEPKRRALTIPKWPADLDTEVCRLLSTAAYRKWSAGLAYQLRSAEMTAYLDGDGDAAREFVSLMLADAREFVMAGIPLACGRVVQPAELDGLVACHGWIVGQVGKRR